MITHLQLSYLLLSRSLRAAQQADNFDEEDRITEELLSIWRDCSEIEKRQIEAMLREGVAMPAVSTVTVRDWGVAVAGREIYGGTAYTAGSRHWAHEDDGFESVGFIGGFIHKRDRREELAWQH